MRSRLVHQDFGKSYFFCWDVLLFELEWHCRIKDFLFLGWFIFFIFTSSSLPSLRISILSCFLVDGRICIFSIFFFCFLILLQPLHCLLFHLHQYFPYSLKERELHSALIIFYLYHHFWLEGYQLHFCSSYFAWTMNSSNSNTHADFGVVILYKFRFFWLYH